MDGSFFALIIKAIRSIIKIEHMFYLEVAYGCAGQVDDTGRRCKI